MPLSAVARRPAQASTQARVTLARPLSWQPAATQLHPPRLPASSASQPALTFAAGSTASEASADAASAGSSLSAPVTLITPARVSIPCPSRTWTWHKAKAKTQRVMYVLDVKAERHSPCCSLAFSRWLDPVRGHPLHP
jgi:hypothetical protein